MTNGVRLPGPVAIKGIESLRAPVPRWVPNLPVHPVPTDLLKESSFAPHSRRVSGSEDVWEEVGETRGDILMATGVRDSPSLSLRIGQLPLSVFER